ncbi:MAG: CoA-transferase [Candidatus Promineifilaceae bacterium]|nr:CoA-transferase [Candidatus Promineifilaceae bacterium]
MQYSPAELMIVAASRALIGSRIVFVGVGLPNIACNLARNSHSPALELVYESGIFGAHPARLPLSIGDPTLISDATSVTSMADLFMLYLQGGLVDTALLGGAQIDRFGNLNTTVIGDYDNPKVRLPGSGGACEIAINAQRTLVIMRLKRRAFVEQLHFRTSPGHLSGGQGRSELQLPGKGPSRVITDRALFDFHEGSREMRLCQVAPGETVAAIRADVGWPLMVADDVEEIPPPTPAELRLIREELDPEGMYR